MVNAADRNWVSLTLRSVARAILANRDLRKVLKFLSPRLVVKATRRRKPVGHIHSETILVTFGAPNFAERDFIKRATHAGVKFPIHRLQSKPFPIKRS